MWDILLILLAVAQLPATLWVIHLRLSIPRDHRAWVAGAVSKALDARRRVAVEHRPAFDRWLTHRG